VTLRRGLLLDLDGTLADSLGVMWTAYAAFLADHGHTPTQAEFDRLNGPPLAEVVAILCRDHAIPGDPAALLERYGAALDTAFAAVRPMPGARDLLVAARAAGWATAVVTSNARPRVASWLEAELPGLVDVLVTAQDCSRGKPFPDPYLKALELTGAAAAASLAVEDSPHGAQAALAAGVAVCGLLPPGGHEARLWPAGVRRVAALAEIVPLLG
jgi:HAD superfamily hydrolase (TIGR01509 family)